jgi:hypothetical protein
MSEVAVGAVVVVHCRDPKEKLWGLLTRLDAVGVGVRGMDLGSVEDWIRQESADGVASISPSSFFLPMHRVQRIDLDESSAVIAGFGDRYRTQCGRDVREALMPSLGDEPS